MALKTAQIFKDFLIAANADNTGVTFKMVAPIAVEVKNDNFAEQVEILDNTNTTDLFDYKYVTFDGSAVFTITDCIKNGRYTTLFIQYLSNIKFDEIDTNFRVDAVSAYTLQRLGLDLNDFLAILGNNLKIDTKEFFATIEENQEPLFYAIKLRFSSFPQNLNSFFTTDGTIHTTAARRAGAGNRLCVHSYFNRDDFPTSAKQFSQFDNAITAILPVPMRGELSFVLPNATIYADTTSLLIALSELITDLTLTAEITLMSGKSLAVFSQYAFSGGQTINPLSVTWWPQSITIPAANTSSNYSWGTWLRCTDNAGGSAYNYRHPCFVTEMQTGGSGQSELDGFWECYNYIKFNLPYREYIPNVDKTVFLSISFLNNSISLKDLRNSYVLIQRRSQALRVFVDFERNVFSDVETSFEFAKNAYSNYDAYQKSNIDLINRQAFASLEMQQQQSRGLQTVDTVKSVFDTVANVGKGIADGALTGITGVIGGLGQLVSGAANIAANEIKFNMKQQNEKANATLSAAQQHEKIRGTIVPTSEYNGSLSFLDAFVSSFTTYENATVFFVLKSITLSNMQLAAIEKYAFENYITDRINDVTQIAKPIWQTLHDYFIAKIENRNPINNRKSFIIFAEV